MRLSDILEDGDTIMMYLSGTNDTVAMQKAEPLLAVFDNDVPLIWNIAVENEENGEMTMSRLPSVLPGTVIYDS